MDRRVDVDQLPVAYCSVDRKGVLQLGNRAALHLLGIRNHGRFRPRPFASLFAEAEQAELARFFERVFAGKKDCVCEVAMTSQDGKERWMLQLKAAADAEAEACHLTLLDISERKRSEQRLEARAKVREMLANDEALSEILKEIALGVESTDVDALCSIMLIDEQSDGDRLIVGAAPHLPATFVAAVDGMAIGVGQGSCGTASFTGKRVVCEDVQQHPYWRDWRTLAANAGVAACWSQPIPGTTRRTLGALALYHTAPRRPTNDEIQLIEEAAQLASIAIEKHRASKALRASEERWKFALEGSYDGIWDWNVISGEMIFSPRWLAMFGYSEQDRISHVDELRKLIHADDREQVEMILRECLDGRSDRYAGEFRLRCRDGSWKWTLSRGMVVSRSAQGQALRMIGTQSDISEQKRLEEELRALTTTDPITRLANHQHFCARLREEHARLQRQPGLTASVVALHLDGFKNINGRFGHAVGDEILAHFGELLRQQLRVGDVAGHLGSGEFAIMLAGSDASAAKQLVRRLRQSLAKSPIAIGDEEVFLVVSVGVSLIKAGDTTFEASLLRAENALRKARPGERISVAA
ncbi:diguanylate cyclase [Rhodocyclus purpureus]|uniref:diguanylate cyclase n=1 Tax=Rhodocyclus purpureus TaxID=1067 RepID=UPI001912AF12|nr:diguanylate cyclase [Rhodocyclus purpureus]MBK5913547.1 hypothetical protein [Rhodocyclus purpureus]